MIYIENQEEYADTPLVVGVTNFYNANGGANPLDVIGGLFEKGKGLYEQGKATVDTITGNSIIETKVGGYDIKVKKEEEQPKKKILGLPMPIFVGAAVTVVLVGGYIAYKYYAKKNN